LRAIPSLGQRGERLAEIEGVVPSPRDWPRGCPFRTRCPRAFGPCADAMPEPTPLSPTHAVRCHAVAAEAAA
jgi:oligopeptide/dipeptide ABC transporter ATP-binding protein